MFKELLLIALSNITCFLLGYYVSQSTTKVITIDKNTGDIKQINKQNIEEYNDLEPVIYITPEMELEHEQRLKRVINNDR